MSRKREILAQLSADELRGLVDRFEVEVADRRARDGMIEALARSHRAQLDGPLGEWPRARLKELCRALGLEDSGKEKAPIVARLLGKVAAPAVARDDDESDDDVARDDDDAGDDDAGAAPKDPPARGKRAAKKGGDLGFEATLWQAADKLRNNMDAAEYKHVVLGLIFLKYISDAFAEVHDRLVADAGAGADPEDRDEYRAENVFWVPKEARWSFLQGRAKEPQIGQLLDDAMVAIERDNPSLKGALPRRYGRTGLDKHRLGELIDLVGTIGLGGKAQQAKDVLGRVYEYFLSAFALAEGKNSGQFYTPGPVVRVLVALLAPYKGRVYDPCCGSGGMFVQSEKFVEQHGGRVGAISVYGQESNETTWKLARMNLAIRGIEANLGAEHADTFHRDLHADLKADYILANPPFNDSDWGQARLADDVRWKYGTPPAGNANFAWVQHFIHHLAPTGFAGFVLANGSMSSNQSGEGEIRKAIIEADLVDCMVALPGQLFYSTQIPVCLWVLARDKRSGKRRDRRGQVLFLDARKLGAMIDRTRRTLTDDDIDRIAGTYHAWRGEPGAATYADIAGFCKSATLDEIRGHQHVLTPGRYVGAEEVEDDGEPFEVRFPKLVAKLEEQFARGSRIAAQVRNSIRWIADAE